MFTIVFYAVATIAVIASVGADRKRTGHALKKAWMAFRGILPEFVVVIVITGIILAFLNPESISRILGGESGWAGVAGAAIVGSVTLMPGFVAFPLAALLRNSLAFVFALGVAGVLGLVLGMAL